MDLPILVVHMLVKEPRETRSSHIHRLRIVDLGEGWSEAEKWNENTRLHRCLQVIHVAEKILQLGASVVGFDLMVGQQTYRPNTCTPRTSQERQAWQLLLHQYAPQIVFPIALVLPKYIVFKGSQIIPDPLVGTDMSGEWAARFRAAQTMYVQLPQLGVSSVRFASGVVTLFAEDGVVRRVWPQIRLKPEQGSLQKHPHPYPAFSMEIARLAREYDLLRKQGKEYTLEELSTPFAIRWRQERIAVFRTRHFQEPPAALRRQFRHAVVLIGAVTDPMRGDLFLTPVGIMPGVLVHAHIVDTILHGRLPARGSLWVHLGCFLVMGLLGWGIGYLAWHFVGRLFLALVGAVLGTLFLAWFYLSTSWLPSLNSVWVILFGCFAWGVGQRIHLSQRAHRQWRDQLYLSLHHPDSVFCETDPVGHQESPETSIIQHFPLPIAHLYRHARTYHAPQQRAEAVYQLLERTACYCTLLAASAHRLHLPNPSSEVVVQAQRHHFHKTLELPSSWECWQAFAKNTASSAFPLPALRDTFGDTARIHSTPLQQLSKIAHGKTSTQTVFGSQSFTLYERHQQADELWDLLTWFLHNHLSLLRRSSLCYIQQSLNPTEFMGIPLWTHLALCNPHKYMVRYLRGYQETIPVVSLEHFQELSPQHLYFVGQDVCLSLSPYLLWAPCREHKGHELFFYTGELAGLNTESVLSPFPRYRGMHVTCSIHWEMWKEHEPAIFLQINSAITQLRQNLL